MRQVTKQKTRYSIELPEEVMEVLRWHVEHQLTTPEQQESDLLFPSVLGGFRAPTVLNKPFAQVADAIGLGFTFTQSGMRRTFNDLARAAEVKDLVTRSISGHLTERMQEHYSTVSGNEQRQSIGKVVDLMTFKADKAGTDGRDSVPAEYHSVPSDHAETGTTEGPSGTQGGTHADPGGTQTKKAG